MTREEISAEDSEKSLTRCAIVGERKVGKMVCVRFIRKTLLHFTKEENALVLILNAGEGEHLEYSCSRRKIHAAVIRGLTQQKID